MTDPVWVGSISVRIADYLVGIYTDDAATLNALETHYDDFSTSLDRDADFGLVVSPHADAAGMRRIPTLLHGRCPMLRSRNTNRLIRSLDLRLGEVADRAAPESGQGAVTGFRAITRSGAARLIPIDVQYGASAFERVVRDTEWRIADEPGVLLDIVRSEVVVAPGLTGMGTHDDLISRPGRYPLKAMYWPHAHDSEAFALADLLSRYVAIDDLSPQATVDAARAIVTGVPASVLPSEREALERALTRDVPAE